MAQPANDDWHDDPRVRKLRAGGSARIEAISALFRDVRPRLHGYFRKHVHKDEIAEELVMETFERVVKYIDGYRGDAPFDGWFWSIARNCLNDWFDAARRTPSGVELDAQEQEVGDALLDRVLGGADDPEARTCVERALDAYEAEHPDRAETIRLVVVEGWDMEQLATYLKRTAGATREYLSQCRKKLEALLAPCMELIG